MSGEGEKKEQFFKAQQELKILFEAVQTAPLAEIKKKIEDLIASPQNEGENLTLSEITKNYKEGNGRTLLHFAASRGDLEVFKYFSNAENEELLNLEDNNQNTPLFIAVQHENLPLVHYILDERKVDIKKTREGGTTVLHIACSTGNVELVEYILDKGANIEASSEIGTPLQWAISSKKKDVAKVLLKKGASPMGISALQELIPPPLILAIDHRDCELVELLLQHGADVNSKDKEGWSGLQFAAEIGDLTITKTLLQKGADPDYECKGQTALELAFMHNQMEIVSFLRNLTKKTIEGKENTLSKAASKEEEDLNPAQAEKLKLEGNELFSQGKLEEALEKYNEALKYDKNSEKAAPVYSNKALCLLKLKRLQESLEASHHAKRVNPTWIKGYLREAQVYEALEEFGEAAASYFEALKIEPDNNEVKHQFEKALETGKARHAKKMKGK